MSRRLPGMRRSSLASLCSQACRTVTPAIAPYGVASRFGVLRTPGINKHLIFITSPPLNSPIERGSPARLELLDFFDGASPLSYVEFPSLWAPHNARNPQIQKVDQFIRQAALINIGINGAKGRVPASFASASATAIKNGRCSSRNRT